MWFDWVHFAIQSSGAADAYRPVLLNGTGKLDKSFLPGTVDITTFTGNIGAVNVTATGTMDADGTLSVGSSGTAKVKHGGGGFTLAVNGTAAFLPNRFVGLILAMDNFAGCCLLISTFTALAIISNPGSTYSTTAGTASKTNIYINASSEIEVQNKTANSTTYRLLFIGDNNVP